MKVLVIGSGGREHALAWRLALSPSVTKVFAAPGNPGIASVAECTETSDYLALAQHVRADLTVVGPEAPLVAGLVDNFRAEGLRVVGPTQQNAALEGSKAHAKRFMVDAGIPTARYSVAYTAAEALTALPSFTYPVVLKSDGLAAGKGVVIATDRPQAAEAITNLSFPLVLEEFLTGDEVSFIALCDGKMAIPLELSQDHKRAFDGDQGPNTGGMGAYSDSRILSEEERRAVMSQIIQPVVERSGFTGFLYAGLMMTTTGPEVLEFNVRLGDPETQPLMMRLDSDLGSALFAAASGNLRSERLAWKAEPATCVVLASEGYPGKILVDRPIHGIGEAQGATVFHAGTRRNNEGRLVTAGGRVLGVTALGDTLDESIRNAYAGVSAIQFEGMQYRNDIGRKGLRRYNVNGTGT